MKKTHTKNILSMAPSLQMFTKYSNQKQQKTPTTLYQGQSLASSSNNPSLKYNRSISSFPQVRKNQRESPDKKYSGLGNHESSTHIKSRPTLPKGMIQLSPFEKIADIFSWEINGRSEESIFDDVMGKFNSSINILQNSMQNESLVKILKQIRLYIRRVLSSLLKLNEKQLATCNQQLVLICNEYECRMKEIEKRQREKISKQFMCASSEIGKKIHDIYHRALFNTQVFNQMEYENIDMIGWIRESEAMDKLMLSMENSLAQRHGQIEKLKLETKDGKRRAFDNFGEGGNGGTEEQGSLISSTKKQYTQLRKQEVEFEEAQLQLVERTRERTEEVQGKWRDKNQVEYKLNKSK